MQIIKWVRASTQEEKLMVCMAILKTCCFRRYQSLYNVKDYYMSGEHQELLEDIMHFAKAHVSVTLRVEHDPFLECQ